MKTALQPQDLIHLDGIVPVPNGYQSVFAELRYNKQNSTLEYQQFYSQIVTSALQQGRRYRVSIVRTVYDHSTYGKVEMFMIGRGWAEILRVGIGIIPEICEVSATGSQDRNEAFTILSNTACDILSSALRIV